MSASSLPPRHPVPPGRAVPPRGPVPPRGEVPPRSPVPPASDVPGRGAVPPRSHVPAGSRVPPRGEVPRRSEVPPSNPVPPGEPVPSAPPPGAAEQGPGSAPAGFLEALTAWPAGVTLLTIADGRDDIGVTVSAFCPVSVSPPLVLVSLIATSYAAEVLAPSHAFAVTLLAADQRVLAGRFASAGRPSARILLAGVPHHRAARSGALIPDGGLAAFECEVSDRIPAGDHVLLIASVVGVPYAAESGEPLIRLRGRYLH